MKTLLKTLSSFLFTMLFLLQCVFAGQSAYIVKQDGRKVYLDISDIQAKPLQGQSFRVVAWGDEIKNPKTGKVLGREAIKTVTGKITRVEPLYATGTLDSNDDVLNQEAELRIIQDPSLTHSAFTQTVDTQPLNDGSLMALWQSVPLEGKVKAIAAGDIDGDGHAELILGFVENNAVKAYTLKDNALKEIAVLPISKLRKVVSLDAGDVTKAGRDQVFAVVYEEASSRFSTLVYEFDGKEFKQTATINGLVKGIAPYNSVRQLYRQDITQSGGKTQYSPPTVLTFKDTVFGKGAQLDYLKFDNIFGFTLGDFRHNGKVEPIYTIGNGLRIQFDTKSHFVLSPTTLNLSSTPNRVSFNNKILPIYLSIGLFKNAEGDTIIAGVQNNSKLGVFAEAFGSYSAARLHFLKWTGNSLVDYNYADIGGIVYDIVQGNLGNYSNVLIVPFATGGGTSTIALFSAS